MEHHLDGPEASAELGVLRAQVLLGIHSAEVFIGVFIGAVTFTGSIVAFLKLSARIKSAQSSTRPSVQPCDDARTHRPDRFPGPALHS